jgi:HAE1 family hydrophobic/amphiphilic exporter-1
LSWRLRRRAALFWKRLPSSFLPNEDQGYMYVALQLPNSASLQRTEEAARHVEDVLRHTPGVQTTTSVVGFNLLSTAYTTYNAFFFVTFKPWPERTKPEERYAGIIAHLTAELRKIPEGTAFGFSPPAIPGVGTAGGFTFVLEDRAGKDISFGGQPEQIHGRRGQAQGAGPASPRPSFPPCPRFLSRWIGTRC